MIAQFIPAQYQIKPKQNFGKLKLSSDFPNNFAERYQKMPDLGDKFLTVLEKIKKEKASIRFNIGSERGAFIDTSGVLGSSHIRLVHPILEMLHETTLREQENVCRNNETSQKISLNYKNLLEKAQKLFDKDN